MTSFPSLLRHFCAALWVYDGSTGLVTLHQDEIFSELCGQTLPMEQIVSRCREQYVCKADLEDWDTHMSREGLQTLLRGDPPAAHFCVRLVQEDHTAVWHEIFLERTDETHVLMGARNIQLAQRNAAIVRALDTEFDYVCHIDIATCSYVLYTAGNSDTIIPRNVPRNYDAALQSYIRAVVVPEESEALSRHMELSHVIQQLEHQPDYVLYATVRSGEQLRHKKFRFCYLSERREKLLLSRVDVSDIVQEQQLRAAEASRHAAYLDSMPIACSLIRVLLNEQGAPQSYEFLYANREYTRLEETASSTGLGLHFCDLFADAERQWLDYYYNTAYHGVSYVLERYSPEIKRHLRIFTFPHGEGCCGCILLDVTHRRFLELELERSREQMRHVLASTTDLVFRYDLDTQQLISFPSRTGESPFSLSAVDLTANVTAMKLLEEGSEPALAMAMERIQRGEHEVTVEIRCRRAVDRPFNWYKLTFFDYEDVHTHRRCIMGYMQNIEQLIRTRESLRHEAQHDPLTGLLNARAAKARIQARLSVQEPGAYHVLFILDIDDFKQLNDTRGHFTGDRVLNQFAQVLSKTFRAGDIIYRLGGDEFAVYADGMKTPRTTVPKILSRLFAHLQDTEDDLPRITTSVGVFATDQSPSFEACYIQADRALYQTKQAGKNNYTLVLAEDAGNA